MTPLTTVRILPTPEGKPLHMPWRRSIAMGRAYELLREDAVSHLRLARERIGFEYCRFHGLFHDDMAVAVRDANGSILYQWHQVDKVLDRLRSIGMRPIVELGPMPAALASGSQTMFAWKMNVTPPQNWNEWSALVEAFTRHVTERYGSEEVRRWYFEVWNEPNLDIFWSGTQEQYWTLYECAARAVKRVDPAYKTGGPASARAEWIPEFLAHCRSNQVPLDFVSTHGYSQDEFVLYPQAKGSPSEPGKYLSDSFRRVREIVGAHDPRLEVHWTEWNSLNVDSKGGINWVSNATVDNAFGGAFVARHAIETDDTCESMAYWTASDVFEELGMPQTPFSGTYGLVSIHGIPKASFRAMELLGQLEGNRLPVECEKPAPAGCGLVATRAPDSLRILLWNNPPPLASDASSWILQLELPPQGRRSSLISTRVGPGAGSAYETWVSLGRPCNLSPRELALLQAHSQPAMDFQVFEDSGERVRVPVEIAVNEILLLTFGKAGDPGQSKGTDLADFAGWAAGFGKPALS